jgi:hypothetical protein
MSDMGQAGARRPGSGPYTSDEKGSLQEAMDSAWEKAKRDNHKPGAWFEVHIWGKGTNPFTGFKVKLSPSDEPT